MTDKRHPATVLSDRLLRASLVVELPDGSTWLVPNSPDGWTRRARLTMTAAAKAERLTVAKGDFGHLGLPDGTETTRGTR